MRTAIIIPARWASKRFPGKPLAPILGVPLIRRVVNIACAAGADDVCVATDDQRIAECVQAGGARVCMTSAACRNGSERVYEAAQQLAVRPEVVVNLQGDAVLTPPWVLSALIAEMHSVSAPPAATPAVQLTREQYETLRAGKARGTVGGTLVVFDRRGRALYFSRALIPHMRDPHDDAMLPVFRHIGCYAFRLTALQDYLRLAPGPLEQVEQLEQLRLLEHGIELRVVPVDYRGRTHWSVDTPEDARLAEEIIRREGELV